ncbi:MAG: helix-turn-helix domain-containing protein [Thiolinea sp.]
MNTAKQTDNEHMSRNQAARYCGVSHRTLERLPIPYLSVDMSNTDTGRTRRLLRYRKTDLDEFLEQHTVVPGQAVAHDVAVT